MSGCELLKGSALLTDTRETQQEWPSFMDMVAIDREGVTERGSEPGLEATWWADNNLGVRPISPPGEGQAGLG